MKKNTPYISIFIFIILGIIWGSSFILMKKAMFGPDGDRILLADEVALLRLIIAMLSLLPVIILRSRKIPSYAWKYLLVVGLFGNGIPAFLFTYAQTYVSSSLAGILNSTVPVFTLILGSLVFGFASSKWNKAGVAVGLIGSVIVIIGGQLDLQYASPMYPALILIATLCYAISVNTIKRFLPDLRPLDITAFGIAIVGIPAAIYFLFSDSATRIAEDPQLWKGVYYTATLAIASTSLALILFNHLIKTSTALFASSVTYIIPIVAVIWGVIDGERLSAVQLLGGVFIILGVALIYRKKEV